MPELPDLQEFSKNLQKQLLGKRVTGASLKVTKASKVSAKQLQKALSDRRLTRCYRDGKKLFIQFDEDTLVSIHLMLHGNLYLAQPGEEVKHVIAEIEFDQQVLLVITDWQKAANLHLNPEPPDAPDALSAAMNFRYLKQKFQSRAAVKNLLLDQKILRGIGNAYADEILWEAKIHPLSVAANIPENKIKELVKIIRKVLKDAEKKIDKNHPGIIHGEVRDFLNIHHPHKEKSPGGSVIKTLMRGGRKTYYTAEQHLFLAACIITFVNSTQAATFHALKSLFLIQ